MKKSPTRLIAAHSWLIALALPASCASDKKDTKDDQKPGAGATAGPSTTVNFAAEAPNAQMGAVRGATAASGVRAIDMGGVDQGVRAGVRAGQTGGVRASLERSPHPAPLPLAGEGGRRPSEGDPSTALRVSGRNSARGVYNPEGRSTRRELVEPRRQSADEQPIVGARTRLDGTSFETVSDKDGKFRLDFAPPRRLPPHHRETG